MQHIGMVACSSEGASLCYRTICAEGARILGGYKHPEISLNAQPLSAYVERIESADWSGVAELMFASAAKLARSGADFLICPDNTVHNAIPFAAADWPLPWLHIAEPVVEEASARGFRRLGITGTRWTLQGDFYERKLAAAGIDCVLPTEERCREMNRVIMDELVYGVFLPESVRFFEEVISELRARDCDAVILGCTEIPLIISRRNAPLPVLDSTRLLARAALARALG